MLLMAADRNVSEHIPTFQVRSDHRERGPCYLKIHYATSKRIKGLLGSVCLVA